MSIGVLKTMFIDGWTLSVGIDVDMVKIGDGVRKKEPSGVDS
jgi:hypothetical protein